ncbi:putative bifunctional diguanylate cyclase/phosphodiesterase [[Clostridium] polysaccharolyticum]|uniref:EAL domain, c-di-GMP-specific phosphodiesterase class I (Or its enzymatically inactive variant) n=1 Tax=[Clostridium] polysaccharolyticum TaxID=29364 RepID=A0A1H9YMQ0_9FIRM|nr:bifunctional diguanylate cyclase/phosphodiesterase [[Clostridium] polysaccharolyticum]SES70336.1 EAL domain, c-di-GMP-specific phosphodiesterase class I (or its enzymatically inactive variant) [[Clostridium] polysaccharolyticum]
MKAQGILMEKEALSCFGTENVFSETVEEYMFYLDFHHDTYCISESAMFKFDLPKTKFYSAEELFQNFIYKEELQYVLRCIEKVRDGYAKKDFNCRCYSKQGEIMNINCHLERIVDYPDTSDIIVGCIRQMSLKQIRSKDILLSNTQFILDFCSVTNSQVHTTGYVMKLGIDNIKEINEKYGLHMAEDIMQCTLECIRGFVDDNVRIYKTGADKLVLFAMNGNSSKKAEQLFRCIKGEVNKYNERMQFPVYYTVSAGVAEFDSRVDNYVEQCKKVDFAFNSATRRGKNDICLFEKTEYDRYIMKLDIEEKLRHAVKHNFKGFEVFYQPIVDVNTRKVTGAEALLRWSCEEFGSLPPSVFVPMLEESGLIVPVGRWVMKTAVKQCKEWQTMIPGFRMNINLSYIQLKNSDIAFDVIHQLREHELDSKYVLFELTESGFVETDSTIRHIIKNFQKQKIKLGLDDFGTGYSNLCYLSDLKVHVIKIDRTFVMKAMKSSYHYKLLRHIIDMAHSIHLKVCVEGVETERELQTVEELKPDYIQGYYFGKPVRKENFYEEIM